MKKLALAASMIIAAGLTLTGPALAKGGHGGGHGHGHKSHGHGHKSHGHGHKFGHYHGAPHGWHHGRKVGWRGHGCPPGLWKQGRC